MAALQHPVGGLPLDGSTTRKSFAEVLAVKTTTLPATPSDPYHDDPLKLGLHKGQPAAFFTDLQLQGLSGAYAWSLVGKFSQGYNKDNPKQGRPSLDALHQYFLSLDLRSDFSLGLLDNRHVLIHLSHEEDYLRLYSRMVWYVGAVTMRVFRWSPYFRVDKESPLVPVWIKMPRLPIMLFEKRTLFSLASLVGRPMRCDAATEALKRPSVARLQVEIDLLKPRPEQIWIGLGEHDGYWQTIEYEFIPDYCPRCWHVGHSESNCRAHNPDFKTLAEAQPLPQEKPRPKLKQIYVAKGTLPLTGAQSGAQAEVTIPPPTTAPAQSGTQTVVTTSPSPVVPPQPTGAQSVIPAIVAYEACPSLPNPGTVPQQEVLPQSVETDSDTDVDELQTIAPIPEPDSSFLDKILSSGDNLMQVPGVQDDFQTGASEKMYSLSALATRSVRPLPHPVRSMDSILSELRAFGAALHKAPDHQSKKRGRPPKAQHKSLPPPMAHCMVTRSQNPVSQPIINE